MNDIFALIEHRRDTITDISFELMNLGRKIADKQNSKFTAVLLSNNTEKMIDHLKSQCHRILTIDHELFKEFNAPTYQAALTELLKKEKPLLTIIGHTAFGMDLAPSLATQLGIPFMTDCLDLEFINNKLRVVRQIFDGKLNARVLLRANPSFLITLRSGCFPGQDANLNATIEKIESQITQESALRKFIEYIEAAAGEVDITKADIVIGLGRGIKEKTNLPMLEDFAKTINGVLACSRPIVDAGWLPKERQVGSSGKTIKPKLYIALGISGAFQHITGIKNSDTVIAINKDPHAPIFNEADYGIIDDLFKVIPLLKNKILEMKK